MLWRRRLHSAFFSHLPLNYETLSQRVAQSKSFPNFSRDLVLDYIQANRTLQRINDESPKLSDHDLSLLRNRAKSLDLEIAVSNSRLEDDLWRFLKNHWEVSVSDEDIVTLYVLDVSDSEKSRAFELVKDFFKSNFSSSHVDPVVILFRKLLQRRDYHNCIGLLDSTYNSTRSLSSQKRLLSTYLVNCGLLAGAMTAAQYLILPVIPLSFFLPFNIFSIFGTFYGLLQVQCSASGDRITWRSHTSTLHRFLHRHEQKLMNMIIAHFEEHSELNVKNFHTAEVRSYDLLGVHRQNNYDIILPTTSNLPAPHQQSHDEHTESLSRYFRTELQKRKMNWEPIKEETRFLDFWLSHGENYEWVEPDQDPAEILNFRSQSSHKSEKRVHHQH